MNRFRTMLFALLAALLAAPAGYTEDVPRRVANDGQLILENVPRIPPELAESLNRYQETRSSSFLDWSPGGDGMYIKTRYNEVNQVHQLAEPGAKSRQLTFTDEPVLEVARQPRGKLIAFTMSRGGSGFDQIYLLDPAHGEPRLLTDGKSLNNRMVWDSTGNLLAYRSTRRDGQHNDIWLMDVNDPEGARAILEVDDGALWKPVEFSADGKVLLVQHYAGITESRIYLLDIASGQLRLLVGDPESPSSNVAAGFDRTGVGVHFVTNQRNDLVDIAWVPVDGEPIIRYMPSDFHWDVTEFELSDDATRGAFVTNEDGISQLYLFDSERQHHRKVRRLPVGVITGLKFSPDGNRLGMTLSTSRTPNDVFVLRLGSRALKYRKLSRWTFASVGGLDVEKFIEPRLIHYKAPLLTDERTLRMPAFVYRPRTRKPVPVLILVHGGPESQFRPSFDSTIQMWVDKLGIAVIAPNVRGSLGYGISYLVLDDTERREHAVRDIGALLDWISERREFDESRVAVYGASYGGYMALASAVHYSDRIRAAVDRAGISNFVTYLENTQDYRRDMRRIEYGDERDPEMRAFLERISPLNNVDRIKVPLLIVQGQNDPVVPVSESEQMVRALRERGQEVWYMNALNEGHGYEKKENQDVFQEVTYLFLQRFLLGEEGS
jgi:dipeptidyl aminopeptidase/acylaminoacyl peptidase